jgi:hypothetical protein
MRNDLRPVIIVMATLMAGMPLGAQKSAVVTGQAALIHINNTIGRGSAGVDLDAIPVAAIERIEVLRDGAAAQYGSDAIAGVINIVLKSGVSAATVELRSGGNFGAFQDVFGPTTRISRRPVCCGYRPRSTTTAPKLRESARPRRNSPGLTGEGGAARRRRGQRDERLTSRAVGIQRVEGARRGERRSTILG